MIFGAAAMGGAFTGGFIGGYIPGKALRRGFGYFALGMGAIVLVQEVPHAFALMMQK